MVTSSNGDDLSNDVKVSSDININKIGEYTVTYKYKDAVKTRKINVVARPKQATYIFLYGSLTTYLNVSEEYKEPGYMVIDSVSDDLTEEVTVSGTVDVNKSGTYKLVYKVVNDSGVTITTTRTVIIMQTNINLSLANSNYTNESVGINVVVADNYFDYLLLPNGEKTTKQTYTYKVNENGTYKFVVYTIKGHKTEKSIQVNNIDKINPSGTCSGIIYDDKTTITVAANDSSGISKYVYENNTYNNNMYTINKKVSNVNVLVYDKAGNSKNINCSMAMLMTGITHDYSITPVTIINVFKSSGKKYYYTDNECTYCGGQMYYYSVYNSTIQNKYNYSSSELFNNWGTHSSAGASYRKEAIVESLKMGHMILIQVSNHFIAVVGISIDDKIYAFNPNGSPWLASSVSEFYSYYYNYENRCTNCGNCGLQVAYEVYPKDGMSLDAWRNIG